MARPKAPGVADIEEQFSFHPATEETGPLHDQVRDILKKTALALNKILPPGRHASLAKTKLQEAMFFANASIAIDLGKQGEVSQEVSRALEIRSKEIKAGAEKAVADAVAPVKAAATKRVASKKAAAKPTLAERLDEEEVVPQATVTPIKRVARRAARG